MNVIGQPNDWIVYSMENPNPNWMIWGYPSFRTPPRCHDGSQHPGISTLQVLCLELAKQLGNNQIQSPFGLRVSNSPETKYKKVNTKIAEDTVHAKGHAYLIIFVCYFQL